MEIATSPFHWLSLPRIKPANFVLAAWILNLGLPTRSPYLSVNYTGILTTQWAVLEGCILGLI